MLIDFYRPELNYFNSPEDLKQKNIDLLVLGDSFSAGHQTYVGYLQKAFPDKTIINSAVVGTGIKQANFILSNRLNEFQPKNILYQIYLGNDLIDLQYPVNWNKISFARNAYWTIAQYFRVVSFINYRLRFLKRSKPKKLKEEDFLPESYTKRTRMYLETNPYIYENMLTLESPYDKVYHIWQEEFEKLIANIPKKSNLYVVFIPHCTQLNKSYLEDYRQLGMEIQNEEVFNQKNDAFFQTTYKNFKGVSNVFLLNPLNFLKQTYKEGTKLYYNNDPHFNAQGHELMAQFLSKNINY